MLFNNKLKSFQIFLIISIGALLLGRLLLMATLVLTDNTESRYAEIARLTLAQGFWLMPHTDIGQPFFAKPPLSTWLSALSGKLFGTSAFSMRLPAFLAGLLTLCCIWQWDKQLARSTRLFCVFVAVTCPLFFISIGAVMTDAIQMACVTLALLCAQRCITQTHNQYWRIVFWLACGLGMLIKGLATLALIFLPLILFALSGAGYRLLWQKFWSPGGIALGLLICIPWYIAAESAYPGFLQYFFIGEHLMRFIDPNWSGDRFGHPHRYPLGTIWLFWIVAVLPWAWIFIRRAYLQLRPASWSQIDTTQRLLWCACLAPLLFFTFSRSIIATYPLTAIPPFIMLMGYWHSKPSQALRNYLIVGSSILIGSVLLISMIWLPKKLEAYSARTLIGVFQSHALPEQKLIYSFQAPYSAYFYSQSKIQVITQTADWLTALRQPGNLMVLTTETPIPDTAQFKVLYQDKQFILVQTK